MSNGSPAGGELWPWIELAGSEVALERVLGELSDSGLSGCEHLDPAGLRLYWPDGAEAERARELCEAAARRHGASVVRGGAEPRQDWLAPWRESLKPLRVSRRLWIAPPWDLPETAGEAAVIVIDQKRAFGTGHHATTRLALEWLDRTVTPGMRVADVGAGSAILAIAAARLGAARVLAFEIDPEVLPEARENLALNGAAGVVELIEGDFAEMRAEPCDLAAVNILASRLLPRLEPLARLCRPEARVLVSGVAEAERGELRPALVAAGFAIEAERELDGWLAFECRAPRP